MFNPETCPKKIWCGNDGKPENYHRQGTSYECFKKGYGTGYHQYKKKQYDPNNLFHLPYMTESIKNNLNQVGIFSVESFLDYIRESQNYSMTKKKLFQIGYTSPDSFNNVLFYLFENRIPITKIPQCIPIDYS